MTTTINNRKYKKLRIKDNFYFVQVLKEGINIDNSSNKLQCIIQEFEQTPNDVKSVKIGKDSVHAIWLKPKEPQNPIAFYKNQPIENEFIIADVIDEANFYYDGVSEITLHQAVTAIDNLTFYTKLAVTAVL